MASEAEPLQGGGDLRRAEVASVLPRDHRSYLLDGLCASPDPDRLAAQHPRHRRDGGAVVTLLLTVLATVLLATPVALHRGLLHRGVKAEVVAHSTRIAEIGLVVLALSIIGAVLLVVDIVLGLTAAAAISAGTALVFALFWAVLPWRIRRRHL